MKTAVLIVTLFMTIANGFAAPVVVSAQANLYGAGHATPPAPSGNGAGVLPPVLTVTAGQSVSFTLMTGTVTHSNGSFSAAIAPFGPEGYNVYNTSLGSLGGISSISGDHFFWLAGVFLDDTEPSNPAPSGLPYFSAAAKQFTSLSPGLRQIFFIGDGQQAGSPQEFIAPTGATHLFLGFIDENSGQVGHYGDNVGSFTVTHNVPEPSTADFDEDEDVDGNDFLIWQRGVGATMASRAQGDANGDQEVDADDLLIWKTSFGEDPPVMAVPEPAAWISVVVAAGAFGRTLRRRLTNYQA